MLREKFFNKKNCTALTLVFDLRNGGENNKYPCSSVSHFFDYYRWQIFMFHFSFFLLLLNTKLPKQDHMSGNVLFRISVITICFVGRYLFLPIFLMLLFFIVIITPEIFGENKIIIISFVLYWILSSLAQDLDPTFPNLF